MLFESELPGSKVVTGGAQPSTTKKRQCSGGQARQGNSRKRGSGAKAPQEKPFLTESGLVSLAASSIGRRSGRLRVGSTEWLVQRSEWLAGPASSAELLAWPVGIVDTIFKQMPGHVERWSEDQWWERK